jgi:hypothetical protein
VSSNGAGKEGGTIVPSREGGRPEAPPHRGTGGGLEEWRTPAAGRRQQPNRPAWEQGRRRAAEQGDRHGSQEAPRQLSNGAGRHGAWPGGGQQLLRHSAHVGGAVG